MNKLNFWSASLFLLLFTFFGFLLGVLNLWIFYELWYFTHLKGKMRRGVVIGRQSLTWEIHQFLVTLPTTVLYFEQHFIRKEGSEILIAEERSFWWNFWLRGGANWPYVVYVNLSMSENQLEFRVSLAYIVSLIISPFIMLCPLIWFLTVISTYNFRIPIILWLLVPTILLAMFVSSILFNHYRERNRLLNILNRAREHFEPTSLS